MIVRVKAKEGVRIPAYGTVGAAAFDLASYKRILVDAGETKLIPTGLYFEIPVGYEMQIRPRSGMSLKTSLRIANSPATIDSDYRGEVGIIVTNIGSESLLIGEGDRIAQGVISPVPHVEFEVVEELDSTERGAGGFGSTGT